MKTFEQFVTAQYITEEISLEEAEQLLEMARDTESSTHRDLTTNDNDFDTKKSKTIPVVHVKNQAGHIVRTYKDPAHFNRNKAMHVAANHTFHRDVQAA